MIALNTRYTIYQLDPSNYCKWSVLFPSQDLKDKLERKEVTLSRTDKNTNKTYSYNIRTNGAPRGLLVTIQSSPLINNEIRDSFCRWGVVKQISHRGYSFAPHIDSELRRVFLNLRGGVSPEDVPWYITFLDRVKRKVFFKGKRYACATCGI